LVIVGLGIAIGAMVVFILLSHRIAGPLYRFEKILNEIALGDLTKRLSLRKTDQLAELKEALNVLMESFDQRMGRMKNNLSGLKELLSQKDDPGNIEKIYKAIELLKNEIDHFKVTSSSKE
jgi:methyl-accepting chemotaxis protein